MLGDLAGQRRAVMAADPGDDHVEHRAGARTGEPPALDGKEPRRGAAIGIELAKSRQEIVLTGTDVSLSTGIWSPGDTPVQFVLSQNYPNPFNPITTIDYQIGHSTYVTLRVYDILGREVATLVDGVQGPGHKSMQFPTNARSTSGEDESNLVGGTYFYRLQAGEFVQTKKLLLLR